METPAGFGQDGFADQTSIHPVGLLALLILGVAVLVAPRKFATWPIVIMACFIASGQRITIASCDFHFLRIMLLFVTCRILMRSEYRHVRPCLLDVAILMFIISGTGIYVARVGTFQSLVFRLGWGYDTLGMYVAFRCLIRSWEDAWSLCLCFLVCSIPVIIAFTIEHLTRRNPFAFLGGVPEITQVREDRLRCQGAFNHPILAGCFWAAVFPLIVARWLNPIQSKVLTLTGIACCLGIVVLSASSTPILAVGFAVIGWMIYPLRRHMWIVQIFGILTAIILQLCMKGPIWSLLAKANITGGSTGWHRYHLFDAAVNHFSEWCVWGTNDTSHWGWGLWDVTNHFILEGVRGGFATLFIFILILAMTFRKVGQLIRISGSSPGMAPIAWGLGVLTFVNITSFFAVSFYGQISLLIWMAPAALASLCDGATRNINDSRELNGVYQ